MKYILLFLPIFINAQIVNVQGSINSNDGPLEFATISIVDSDYGVTSNENGYFEIQVDSSKDNYLLVSYLGYISKKISLKNIDKDLKNLVVVLEEDINGLNEIIVTGSLRDQFVTESPVKVNVITSKKINSFLPSAGSTVKEIIQLINGAQEVIACGVCYTNSISINGLEGPYTSILLDGIPMYGNLASVYGLSGIPSMIIDRIEIVKGPSSTLYGSEAVAGVINIITKNFEDQPYFSLDIQGTSYSESYINLAIAPKVGKSKTYFGSTWDKKNYYKDYNDDGFGDDINFDRFSLFNKWDIFRKSKKKFIINTRYYFEDRRNGVEDFMLKDNYKKLRGSKTVYGESINTYRFELFGKYEFDFLDDFELNYSYSKHNQNSFYGSDFYKAKQEILFSQFTLKRKFLKHDMLYGLSFRKNMYDDNTSATEQLIDGIIFNESSNQFTPGIFIQDQYSPSNKISIISGLRVDNYKDHGSIFSPSLHFKYNPGEWLSFRLNAGTGFRIVNLFSEDHAFVTGQREVKILEELQPERSKSIILNSNYIYSGLSGTGNLDLDIFYTHFSNKIIPSYEDIRYIIYKNSKGYAYTKGFSGAWNHTFLNGIAFTLNFNHQIAKYYESNTISNIEHSPNWTASLNFKLPFKNRWSLNTSSNFTGEMQLPVVFDMNSNGELSKFPRPVRSNPFSIHNINISGELNNNHEIYFGLLNVLNFRQKESSLVAFNDPNHNKGFSPFFDTSYVYAPNQGVEFFLGYKFNLNDLSKRK
jgi:outer membrane receptor for ferrienterochelin and colicins